MRKRAFAWGLSLISLALVQAQQDAIVLPDEILAILDHEYHTWNLVDNSAVLQELVLRGMNLDTLECHPNLVCGDFDGDGRLDYAAYVQASAGENKRMILAFLRRGESYRQYLLGRGSDYIWLVRRGARQYDYDTGKHFRQKHDAIIDVTIEKGAITYVYENGGFREIITSD
jgi:hypothetical protein